MNTMNIINRYLGLTFLKTLAMSLVGFITLYTAIDFIEKIGDFMGKDIGISTTLLFFIAQMPKIIVLMAPVATLVAVMITLTILARNSEIVAFKAGGVSLYRLSAPIVAMGLAVCVIMFGLSDFISPRTTAVANKIWQGQVKERLKTTTTVNDVWLKGLKFMQHINSYDETTGGAEKIRLIFTDEDMHLARRLEAESGRFINNQFHLEKVKDKKYLLTKDGRSKTFTLQYHDLLVLENWAAPPPGFGRSDQNSDELSVAQLWKAIDRLRNEGFNPVRQRVDLQFKFSFALLPIIMVVVGLPIGFWREKGGSVALGLALGLILSFIYLITMELAKYLGYSGLLPPLVAAWLPNLLFFLFGAYLFSYVRQ